MLRDVILDFTFDIDILAKRTDGLSGSDLKELCRNAACQPVREQMKRMHTKDLTQLSAGASRFLHAQKRFLICRAGDKSATIVFGRFFCTTRHRAIFQTEHCSPRLDCVSYNIEIRMIEADNGSIPSLLSGHVTV